MFDTINHSPSSREYVPYEKSVTVHEHRAPTDKSVALLNELTQSAKDNIIDSVHIQNNVVECAVIFYRGNVMRDEYDFGLRFKLNGHEYKLQGIINSHELHIVGAHYGFRSQKVLDLFIDRYSKTIAEELIKMEPKAAASIIQTP